MANSVCWLLTGSAGVVPIATSPLTHTIEVRQRHRQMYRTGWVMVISVALVAAVGATSFGAKAISWPSSRCSWCWLRSVSWSG
jgi:hypothetical protein